MQTWWFMRRMYMGIGHIRCSHEPLSLWDVDTHCLKIWTKCYVKKHHQSSVPNVNCYTNAVKWYFRIDNHETSSPLPLHFGQKPSNSVPWDQAVEPYLLWQLSVNLMRRCWKTPRGLMRIGPADPCHDSDVDCWWLKSSELVCVYHNFPFGCRNWREPLDWENQDTNVLTLKFPLMLGTLVVFLVSEVPSGTKTAAHINCVNLTEL